MVNFNEIFKDCTSEEDAKKLAAVMGYFCTLNDIAEKTIQRLNEFKVYDKETLELNRIAGEIKGLVGDYTYENITKQTKEA